MHYGTNYYLRIDSGGSPLLPTQGLCIATTMENGNYYYAVTTELNGLEDTAIITGVNSISNPIAEEVMVPHPVFQQFILLRGKTVELYTNFYSFKTDLGVPPILAAAFIASDFLLYRNTSTGNQPLVIQMHGGGSDFFNGIDQVASNEMILSPEWNFPSGDASTWGANSNYDIYHSTDLVPSAGVNFNFFQQIFLHSIDWAIAHLNLDSNRIYLRGFSAGACGAYALAITYPEKIAAVQLSVPCFDIGFTNDSVPYSSFNPGMPSRVKADQLIGTVASNLPSNLDYPTFNILNGGWRIHQAQAEDFPFIYAMNGKNDVMVGWTEKTVYYDSVNANNPGGYYFWDNRQHNGNGAIWGGHYFDLFRFRRNAPYPALGNCRLNENYGNGAPQNGAAYGTVNGALNWCDPITDSSAIWEMTFFIRDLPTQKDGMVVYPDSATVDFTPRRTQQFHAPLNVTLYWQVIRHDQVIQADSVIHDGGVITIRGIKVFKDSVRFRLWYSLVDSFYADGDGDNYSPAQGDCNDYNASIHPGTDDICNGQDDNCDGREDENAFSAITTPAGSVSACNGTAVLLEANGGAGINYQWQKNGLAISGATNQTYLAIQTASYSIYETNSFSCNATSPATSVTFLSLPAATATPLGDPDICLTGSVDLQANSGNKLTYQWKKGSNNIAGATNQVYTATTTGNYKVVVTNKNSCSRTSAAVKVTRSCKERSVYSISPSPLNIFPNPNAGKFVIEGNIGSLPDGEAVLQIVNASGQILHSRMVMISEGHFRQEFQLDFPAGIYQVNVKCSDEFLREQVMIAK